MNGAGVMFDLDGTLLDSLADIANAANQVLAQRGFPQHSLTDYRHLVGEGVAVLFERGLPEPHRDSANIAACVSDFRETYRHQWHLTSRPYNGILELLRELAAQGAVLAVLSNKPDEFTQQCVAHFLPQVEFAAVAGMLPTIPRKPDPAGALAIARQLDLPANRWLYVGDTSIDMQTATRAGMFAVGVTWGFRGEPELRDNGAQAIIHHPSELLTLIQKNDERPRGSY